MAIHLSDQPPYRAKRLGSASLALIPLVVLWLSACNLGASNAAANTLAIATFFPTSGVDAPVGQALQNAVDLAVQQHAALGRNLTLTTVHVDAASSNPISAATNLAADLRVMAIVGPLDSQAALGMLPLVSQNSIATLSPGATLPGLTLADAAAAEKLPFAQLHPKGKPIVFFRIPRTDTVGGKVAADLAVAPETAHGLAARTVFLVDDGSASGKAAAVAFAQELKANGGTVAGQQSLAAGVPDSAQSAVTAIIASNPDLVFYAGGMAAGAELRGTLSLSGAPQLPLLAAGAVADHPAWADTVGEATAATHTTAILPAPDLAAMPKAKNFVAAYQAAFPQQAVPPQSVLAYDAAMDAIAAIQSLINSNKAVTRAGVRAAVAAAKYPGVAGTLAFDANGDNTTPLGFSLYSCDSKGVWHYQSSLKG